ncbi:MAG: LPS export ABC transporter periplasmic protein LptC [Burkholderiales bacterium]|nr:MAG: LPS export ABC transporter periplasmic protein LptC [Betaproteobacteria bacterium]TAG69276.1 MAG: LPS export ABC transporter periplasmic protein LptC [Burkholderiales bacterium]
MSMLLSRRRQDRLTALFPLIAMMVFAAITFWLDARVTESARARQKPTPTAPDHFLETFKIERTAASGQVEHTMVGVRATHFPNTQSTIVEQPNYRGVSPGKPTMTVEASRGVMLSDAKNKGIERIDFSGQVSAAQSAIAGRDAVTYQSQTLTVFPKTQQATTRDTTKTISGERIMTTQGIDIDADNQTGKTSRGFNLELTPKEQKSP